MRTIIAALTLLALFSQANANDAINSRIEGVWRCVEIALDAAPGKPRVHPDAILVAIRACKGSVYQLSDALDAEKVTEEEKQKIVETTVNVMFDAWAIK